MAIEVWVKVKDFGGPQIGMSMFSMNHEKWKLGIQFWPTFALNMNVWVPKWMVYHGKSENDMNDLGQI